MSYVIFFWQLLEFGTVIVYVYTESVKLPV